MSLASRSYVISWNLTRRCNLECEHCYIEAEHVSAVSRRDVAPTGALAGELDTAECRRVIDQIAASAPDALLILTGGEPLLRRDIFEIAGYASRKGLWTVMGTNGVLVTELLADKLIEAGVKGMSLSLDALDPETHDRFRAVKGAFRNTLNGAKVLAAKGLPFIVQTTLHSGNLADVERLAELAFSIGARVFNLYFLVPTGRGAFYTNVTPAQYEEAMRRLIPLQKAYAGRMLINSKCAPHYQRVLHENDPGSPFLKSFNLGAGGCPAGTHYLGIRPNGDMTPCPYLPVYGGNLREKSFSEIWTASEPFVKIRARGALGGRCGPCEYNAACGGCRARAYGETGDYMAEDTWCVHEPKGGAPVSFESAARYGEDAATALEWTPEAKEGLARAPAFVRGMIAKRVEAYARERGLSAVTAELLAELKAKMPVVPSFGRTPKD